MTDRKAAQAAARVMAARQAGVRVSVQALTREYGVSRQAIYAYIKREEGRQRCPCCGQVVKDGYQVNRDVLAKNRTAKIKAA